MIAHPNQLDQSISVLRAVVGVFQNSNFNRTLCWQIVETDQMPRSVASGLGLHYLPTSHKKDAMLIWVNACISLTCKGLVSVRGQYF